MSGAGFSRGHPTYLLSLRSGEAAMGAWLLGPHPQPLKETSTPHCSHPSLEGLQTASWPQGEPRRWLLWDAVAAGPEGSMCF